MGHYRTTLGICLWACALAGIGAWWFLLGTICSAPLAPNVITGNIVAYNCHGTTVFITALQQTALYILIPVVAIIAFAAQKVRRWPYT